ncbi:MAG TPA: diguanylate cyclase, partial [Rhizobacter sp.]|nr:diguanylate cyclase [Rhizobacter sp.]
PAQMLERHVRDAVSHEFYELIRPHLESALAGQQVRWERQTVRDGQTFHYLADYIPDVAADGSVTGCYALTIDITERRNAELAVARVERRLRGITDNLPVLISYLDKDERYLFLNATFKTWLGIDPASVIGRRLAEVVEPAEYEARRELLHRALAGERVEFDNEAVALGMTRSLQNTYLPDIQPDGSVAGVFALSTDVTTMKQVELQLNQLARVDGLTGLPNRRRLEEILAEAVARAARAGKPVALMFLDIDHFKTINDTLGHGAGDAVLKEFGLRLKRTVRSTDTPARLAGDEFVVLIEGLHSEREAALVAEKVIAAIRKPFSVDDRTLQVTSSIGVAYCACPGPDTALMTCADAALYEAKAVGRDTYRVSTLDPVFAESTLQGLAQ